MKIIVEWSNKKNLDAGNAEESAAWGSFMYSSPPRWAIGVLTTAFESPYHALDRETHPILTHTLPHSRTLVEVGDSDSPAQSKTASSSSTRLQIRALSTDSGS